MHVKNKKSRRSDLEVSEKTTIFYDLDLDRKRFRISAHEISMRMPN